MDTGCAGVSDIDQMRMSLGERRDWQKIIREVSAMYQIVNGRELTDYKLGDLIEMRRESVEILRVRGEPRVTPANLLLKLHTDLSKNCATRGATTT